MDKKDKKKTIVLKYFSKCDAPNSWKCSCGKILIQRENTGYTNLFNHIKSQHVDYSTESPQPTIDNFAVPKKAHHIYSWLEWVCVGMKPFEFVENELTRKYSNLEPISVNTLKKYIVLVTKKVEEKISLLLPSKFAIVIDGWTSHSTHFVGMFATFPSENTNGYEKFLLAFSPMGTEMEFTAIEHYNFIEYVLSVYKKTLENVVAIIADNCDTNKALANLCLVPMIGCASHRYNLAVKDVLVEHSDLIDKINTIMGKLKNLKLAGQLRKYTELVPIQKNVTRWSSTANMVFRYLKLIDFIAKPEISNDPSIVDLIPTARENTVIITLSKTLEELNSVTIMLQKEDIDMSDVRYLFDNIIESYPELNSHCGKNASIIHSVDFENTIVKILDGKESDLCEKEKDSVVNLKLNISPVETETAALSKPNFAADLLKRRKMEKTNSNSAYMNCKFLRPTSNMVERFFSLAKFTYNDLRKKLLPYNLEMQLFLNLNGHLWNDRLVMECISESDEN